MDLEKYTKENKQRYEIWVEFSGFELKIKYAEKSELSRMLDRSKERVFDKRTHRPIENLSDEKFDRNLSRLITGWRDLTLKKLAELIPIKVDPSDEDELVPYSKKNAETLVREAYGLDNFLMDTVTDLQAFKAEQMETELGNSETSQDSISD